MKHTFKTIIVCALLALSACVQARGRSNTSANETQTTYTINGVSPEAYYSKFLFMQNGVCGTSRLTYRFPKAVDLKVGVNGKGQDVLAEVSIVMLASGTYQARYKDFDVIRYIEDGYMSGPSRETLVTGRWKVVNDKLAFENLGVASALNYNQRPAFSLQIENASLLPKLKGRAVILMNVLSTSPPISDLDVCP